MTVDPRFFEQARSFVAETMKAVIPDANVDGGSGINAILGRGGATITSSLLQEIEHLLTTRDLTNPEALTETDMDLIMENLLTDRDGGDLAFGFVRLFYADRVRREFASGLTATIESKEVNFLTLSDFEFDPQDYFLDSETDLYYVNVPFAAESAGEEFNVDVGEINQLLNDTSAASRITNVEAFRNGKPKQTNTQALRKAQRSVSTRTPLSRDGAIFFMQELFSSKLKDLLVIGAGDEEMLRDEVFDLGATEEPRFQVGIDSLDPVTRQQLGSGQELNVGGRTDLYSLFDTVNFIQIHVDLFADMLLDTDVTVPIGVLQATFVPGTTGAVAATGKLIIDLGNAGEETVAYSLATTIDGSTYTFTLVDNTAQIHAPGATVKVVNNSEITIATDGDITVVPLFQMSEVRLLDPITFQPIGDSPVEETTPESSDPGWYISKTNRYDLLSAKETKTLVLDEKRDSVLWPGNQSAQGTAGDAADLLVGGSLHTKYTKAGANFTGFQGKTINLSGGLTASRFIIQVLSPTEVVLDGDPVGTSAGDVDFSIDSSFGDFNQYPTRVSYYTNTELGEAQQFLDQDSRRILASDTLARAFLPVFLDFTMQYRGDGAPLDVRESVNEVLKTSSGDAIGESSGAKFDYSDLINAAYQNGLANYVFTPFQVRIRRQQLDGTFGVDYINPSLDTVNELAVKTDPGVVIETDGFYVSATSTFQTTLFHFNVSDVGKQIWIENIGLVTITAYTSGTSVEVDTIFDVSVPSGAQWSRPVYFLEARLPTGVDPFTIPEEGRLFLGAFTSNNETIEYTSVSISGTDYTFIIKDGQSIHLPHGENEPLRISVSDYDDANVIKDGIITDEREFRPFLGAAVFEKLSS
jgi:hypothetical protein